MKYQFSKENNFKINSRKIIARKIPIHGYFMTIGTVLGHQKRVTTLVRCFMGPLRAMGGKNNETVLSEPTTIMLPEL